MSYPTHPFDGVDIDPRPRTGVCRHCGRDIVDKVCVCIPSTPTGQRPVIRLHHRAKREISRK